jgi:hypothetical protein
VKRFFCLSFTFGPALKVLLVTLIALMTMTVRAETEKNYVEVTKWVSEVIGGDAQVALEIGKYDTYQEAADASAAWSKAHPKDLRITREREVDLRRYINSPDKRQESPSLSGPRGAIEQVPGSSTRPAAKYRVSVFKSVNGKWVKQEGRSIVTDDADKARAYIAMIKKLSGWTATSNLPQDLRDTSSGNPSNSLGQQPRQKPVQVAPSTIKSQHSSVVGIWVGNEGKVRYTFRSDGTLLTNSGHPPNHYWHGTWTQSGDKLIMKLISPYENYPGKTVTATIQGDTFQKSNGTRFERSR